MKMRVKKNKETNSAEIVFNFVKNAGKSKLSMNI